MVSRPAVGALRTNTALKELHLTNNHLNGSQDALHLGDLLRYNSTLHTVQLSSNAVADAGTTLSPVPGPHAHDSWGSRDILKRSFTGLEKSWKKRKS